LQTKIKVKVDEESKDKVAKKSKNITNVLIRDQSRADSNLKPSQNYDVVFYHSNML